MIVQSLLKKIDEGREGKNQGYSMGLPKLEGVIDGVTKQTFTVIGSDSGTGKSSLMTYAYIYRPITEHLEDENYRVILFSLEMSADMVFAKLLSTYLFETYGLELSMKELLSRKRGYRLNDSNYQKVVDSLGWLEKVEKHIVIYDKSTNAKLVYAFIHKDLEKLGTFVEEEKHIKYTFNNPNLIYTVIIDHIGLLVPSNGNTLKQEIDLKANRREVIKESLDIDRVICLL